MRLSRSAAALAALLLLVPAAALSQAPELEELVIETDTGEHVFQVEIADEPHEQQRGLMFRREMADEHGMLFVRSGDTQASFWMRNTYIPLDMLFIEADGTIELIAERTTPLSEKSVRSKGPVRYVLEINGGLSDELGIAPGDTVTGPALEARR